MNKLYIFLVLFLAAFVPSVTVHAQESETFVVKGTIVDTYDEPVIGATITIKDKPGMGAVSDLDGNFSMKVSMYDNIVVSYVGFESAQYRFTKKETTVKIVLKEKSSDVDEVVVVGMGTQRKVSVAGAITTIDPKQLEKPATNIVNTLAGRVAGVIGVQSSGEPGKNISEFWVRGIGTFGANSAALVLIDGLEGDLSQVEAADVESFSVLKDASATAVYGNRGANGVVIVTTKRGLEQKLHITARANYTISHLKRLPEYLDATRYAELANEAAVQSSMAPIYSDVEMDIFRYNLDPDLYPNINWQDELLNKNSIQKTYYVSAQGGGSIARYFASLGMSNESSAYKMADDSPYKNGVGYNTYNYRMNLDINLTKTTKVYLGGTSYLSVNDRPSMGEGFSSLSMTDWIWSSQAKTTPVMYPLRYSNGYLPATNDGDEISPYVLLNYTGTTRQQNFRNMITVAIEQDLSMITKGLRAKIQGSFDNQSMFGESRFKKPALYMATGRNQAGELILSNRVIAKSIGYNSASWSWRKWYFDASVNYDRKFNDHSIGALLYYYCQDTAESGATSSMNAIPKRYQSLSGRINYGYKDTYFIDANFGLTGSENFQPGRQYGFFPSAALAWVPTAYKFVQDNLPWLTFLKFRGSYGIVGNDQIASTRFPYLTLISEGEGTTPWGGVGTLAESQVGADNLVWEKAKKMDVGVDFHLFKDKFSATLDYFVDRRDAIFQQRTQVPSYVGLTSMPYGNVGSMKSWGGDGNFEYYQKFGKDFHLTLRGNFTLSKNKILNWEEPKQPYQYLEKNGYANNVQRGFIALGLFKSQEDIDMSPSQFGTVLPGDIKYKDVNGDGKINDDDKVPLFAFAGIPQFMYGFGFSADYKGFTLNVLFKGTGHNYFLYGGSDGSNFDGYMPFNRGFQGNVLALAYDRDNRWTSAEFSGNPSTENPNARFPRLHYGNNSNNTKPSTFWMDDARYLRLQEVSLNYRAKAPFINKMGMQSIDIQLMCENLGVWDSVKIYDPEQATSCGRAYPLCGRYTLQLQLNF
ncbi:MAG: TonB-dependent receptor [Prevotellaceae bacterium]|nr:TonB-dependent receptor [Prevotellaceae bacterium]